MLARAVTLAFAAALVSGCGDKVPESEAAKRLGNAPRQTVDRAKDGVEDALRKGAERTRGADKAN